MIKIVSGCYGIVRRVNPVRSTEMVQIAEGSTDRDTVISIDRIGVESPTEQQYFTKKSCYKFKT